MQQQDTGWYVDVPLKTSAFSKDRLMHFVIMAWFIGFGLDDAAFSSARLEMKTQRSLWAQFSSEINLDIFNVKLQLVINISGEQKYLFSIYCGCFIFFVFKKIGFSEGLVFGSIINI